MNDAIESRTDFPRARDELSAEWLDQVLHRHGAIELTTTIVGFRIEAVGPGQGGLVARIFPKYRGGDGPISIIGKFAQANAGNRALIAMLDIFRSEVYFYKDIAPLVTVRHPSCYHAEASADGESSILLLEDFPEHRLGDQTKSSSMADRTLCMQQIARLHAPFWNGTRPPGMATFAERHGPPMGGHAAAVWDIMLERYGDVVPESIRRVRDEYFRRLPGLLEWSLRRPTTVTQGDFRLDNLLFGEAGTKDALVVLDWQLINWSNGMMDVAYLLTQSVDWDDRSQQELLLLRVYREELARLGVHYGAADCWQDYRRAALLVFSYAICIAGGMSVADERADRWMRLTIRRAVNSFEALALAELLDSRIAPRVIMVSACIGRERPVGSFALITGASSGIGFHFAHLLAEKGYHLVLVARRREKLEELAGDLTARHGIRAVPLAVDLSSLAAAEQLAEELLSMDVSLSCLINNAGRGTTKPFLELPWKTHEETMNLMVHVPVLLTYRLLPAILRSSDPRLINVGSFSSYMPALYGTGLYIGAKSFLFRLTELIAAEYGPQGLRATCVCPGLTDTEIFEMSGADAASIPGRMMSPRRVVEEAWDANERRAVSHVPGVKNRWLTWLGRVLPEATLRRKFAQLRVGR